jgi:hypothetical protein
VWKGHVQQQQQQRLQMTLLKDAYWYASAQLILAKQDGDINIILDDHVSECSDASPVAY